jgi:predicted nucleic acid-binding Zn ribbon protein
MDVKNGGEANANESTVGANDADSARGGDIAAGGARAASQACPACGIAVPTRRRPRIYCSGRCRARASRERKARELDSFIARLQAEAQGKTA